MQKCIVYPFVRINRLTTVMRAAWSIRIIALMAVFSFAANLQAQFVENLTVETYYITDANDANSGTAESIAPGVTVHRLILDICAGCRLMKVYANTNHELRIESTEPFFNASIGGTYGHDLNGALFPIYDAVPLDSYLSFGAANNTNWGVEKSMDPDGSIWANRTAPAALTNEEADLGISLTDSDGLVSSNGASTVPMGWILPQNNSQVDAVFGNNQSSTALVSQDLIIQSTAGVSGLNENNMLLIAQLTTSGDLSFALNMEIMDSLGVRHQIVAVNPTEGEIQSPYLSYPQACGCTDDAFLEYDSNALCDDGSCMTAIVFGCLNESACNYNPQANFDIPELCCFVDSCQGLDPSLICPSLGLERPGENPILVYPNPANDFITLKGVNPIGKEGIFYIADLTGKTVLEPAPVQPGENQKIEVSHLQPGMYVLIYLTGRKSGSLLIQIAR